VIIAEAHRDDEVLKEQLEDVGSVQSNSLSVPNRYSSFISWSCFPLQSSLLLVLLLLLLLIPFQSNFPWLVPLLASL